MGAAGCLPPLAKSGAKSNHKLGSGFALTASINPWGLLRGIRLASTPGYRVACWPAPMRVPGRSPAVWALCGSSRHRRSRTNAASSQSTRCARPPRPGAQRVWRSRLRPSSGAAPIAVKSRVPGDGMTTRSRIVPRADCLVCPTLTARTPSVWPRCARSWLWPARSGKAAAQFKGERNRDNRFAVPEGGRIGYLPLRELAGYSGPSL